MKHTVLSVLLVFLHINSAYSTSEVSMSRGHPFVCGSHSSNVTCDSKGFEICVKPPLIGDHDKPYCLDCAKVDSKCGTYEQIPECFLHCNDDQNDDRYNTLKISFPVVMILFVGMTISFILLLFVFKENLMGKLRQLTCTNKRPDFTAIPPTCTGKSELVPS